MAASIENTSFLWLLLFVSLAFLWLLGPFFAPIFWAIAIAIIFAPVQRWMLQKLPKWRNAAALSTLLACVFIVIIPVIWTVSSVVGQAVDLYQQVEKGEIDLGGKMAKIGTSFSSLNELLGRFGVTFEDLRQRAAEVGMAGGKLLAQHTFSIGQNAFKFALNIGVMLYVAFFLLRDGEKIVDLLIKALPLGDARERLLFKKFAEVTRATVKGNMVVAVVQGTLGGLILWALGIPGAMLWGTIMAVASLVPAIGAAVVWVPVAIYLFVSGEPVKAVILGLFGAFVIGLVDNFLRPLLVGRDTKLPDYIVLLSTLGGLALFGINGFVIGPLIAALFVAFWGIFMREFLEGPGHHGVPEFQESPSAPEIAVPD